MIKDYFNVLEFGKIRGRLAEFATSNFGKELARQIEPDSDFENVRGNLDLTTEAVKIFAVFQQLLSWRQQLQDIYPLNYCHEAFEYLQSMLRRSEESEIFAKS